LNDPRKFKAPYNPKERIWQEADRLRAAYPAGRWRPVKGLLKKLNARLTTGMGSSKAALVMAKLREDTRTLAPQNAAAKNRGAADGSTPPQPGLGLA